MVLDGIHVLRTDVQRRWNTVIERSRIKFLLNIDKLKTISKAIVKCHKFGKVHEKLYNDGIQVIKSGYINGWQQRGEYPRYLSV